MSTPSHPKPGARSKPWIHFSRSAFIILITLLLGHNDLNGQGFTEQTGISLTGVSNSSVAWGDYDNDGDLDILLTGSTSVSNYVSRIYRNNGDNTFTEQTGITLPGVGGGSVAWGDYDNDEDLDILLTGTYYDDGLWHYISKIYKNNGDNTFTEQTGISLAGVSNSSVAWGDYDNDGDLDILLTGVSSDSVGSMIYKNNGDNTFTEQTGISLNDVDNGSVAWGDYDNDGDLDILLTGYNHDVGPQYVSKIYKNNGDNSFTEQTGILIIGVHYSSVAWGDYDNDGDLDILLAGSSSSGYISKIYKNNGDNTFTEQTGILLTEVSNSSVAWGDYDNDGDLDILLTGYTGSIRVSKIYQNNGDNTFTEQTGITLTGVTGSVAWGDYDNDGDLDILLTGHAGSSNYVSKIYKNNSSILNTVPSSPTGLNTVCFDDSVVLAWNRGSDNETPQDGLSYNAYLYLESGDNIWTSMADTLSGYRRTPAIGNAEHDTSWTIKNLAVDQYYWSVQAIDHSYAGSPFAPQQSFSTSFLEQTAITLTGVYRGSVAWGDYDNDGDLDILLTGGNDSGYISKIYRNNGDNTFTEQTGISLTGVERNSIDWGDYDNDGDLDILLTGGYYDGGDQYISKIYQNNGDNTFTEQTGISLNEVDGSSVAWGDYDNDGDLDILLTGSSSFGYISKIYKNNGDNTFAEQTGISLTGVRNSSVAWGDYDNDGDLDILLTGEASDSVVSKIYKNNGDNTFTEQTGISLTGVGNSSVAWGDYDNDGDLDILLTGEASDSVVSKIYKNNGDNTFAEQTGISLTGVDNSSVAWGDYDNDGDLDILLTGYTGSTRISKIYKNNGDNTFTEQTGITLTGVSGSSVAWGDYDNDGDLDILLSGFYYEGTPHYISKIYKNNITESNTAPFAPTGLTAFCNADSVVLSWNKASDNETPQNGLSYNAYLYSENGDTIWSCMADYSNGYRRIPKIGNAQQDTCWTIRNLELGKYYWSVQAIDHSFAGSPFAPEQNFSNIFIEHTGISLTGVRSSSVAWGDYDNDGDLDILLTGDNGSDPITKIFRNDGDNTFTEQTGIALTAVRNSSIAWGDYDNDGYLDILLTGYTGSNHVSKIYKNNGDNTFSEQTGILLPGVSNSSVAWGDYDNDGDLDILLTGYTGSDRIYLIYKNNGDNSFTEQTGIPLTGVENSSVAWGDYDNDGDLDILLAGRMYQNNGDNSFTDQSGWFFIVENGSVAWGDYDDDGDLDVLLTGRAGTGGITKIYKNNGDNTFTEQTGISITGVEHSSVAWGDYDNDGDLDILLTGYYWDGTDHYVSKIYKNNGDNTFTEQSEILLTQVAYGSVTWGDYDNDDDLDILLSGYNGSDELLMIYENNITVANTTPSAPTGLNAFCNADSVVLSWNKSIDNETQQDGLSYNAYMYSEFGDTIWSSMADKDNGYRRIPARGNAQLDTCWTIKNLRPGLYYWSVQAIDHAFAGSPFAVEHAFNNTFTEHVGVSLTGVYFSSAAWGDYDNDDDLDIILTGFTGSEEVSKIYKNNGDNTFTEQTGISLTDVRFSSVTWGDYDNDGDLDILLSGYNPSAYVSKVYQNNGDNTFSEQTGISLTGVTDCSAAWGDYDNDGDLDILLTGTYYHDGLWHYISKIYKNNGDNTFTEQTGISLTGVKNSSVAWGDYDNDGNLDILLTGYYFDGADNYVSKIYKNNGDNSFTEQTGISLTGVERSSVAWGDYDNDRDLDILLAGWNGSDCFSKIYKNNGDNTFTEQTGISLIGVIGSVAWGDYDNDGYLDILLSGSYNDGAWKPVSKIYKNNGDNTFTEQTGISLAGNRGHSAAWGDYDNDGDLDILVTGYSPIATKIYNNNINKPNDPPLEPADIYNNHNEEDILFYWDTGSDNETPIDGLSYNLWVGTSSGGTEIISPHANNTSGYRRIVSLGNAQQNNSFILKGYADSTIYWSVQAIDHGFAGSHFTNEKIYPFIGQNVTDLEGIAYGSASWGDYDNDDDLDVLGGIMIMTGIWISF